MMLMEFDKAGAEWVVVAYVSGDARMIDIIETGKSPHVVTGHLITRVPEDLILLDNKIIDKLSDPDHIAELRHEKLPALYEGEKSHGWFIPRSMSIRQAGKKSNHGLNYGMRYKRFALENEIEEREAKTMVESYTGIAYPGIPLWWEDIRRMLKKDRTLYNLFGDKIELLNEWGDDLFNAAYSYVPQSTIGYTVNKAICDWEEDRSDPFLAADLLTQTHDSATFQYPTDNWLLQAEFAIKFAYDYMSPEFEAKGRKFTIGTDLKVGIEWGNMLEVKLSNNVKEVAHGLEAAWNKLH